jgi:hypothetical protein
MRQEGWLAKHAAEDEEVQAAVASAEQDTAPDPMQGLEGLDVAGPKPE